MLKELIFFIFVINNIYCDERSRRVKRIVGGAPADLPPEDDPVVFTRFAGKPARVEGVRDFPHYVFRGIPYAHPPIGNLRFVRPREKTLVGHINAKKFAPPCVQPLPGQNRVIGSEDCLYLNIFTPELPSGTEGLPVVIWIHGGGFRFGSASQYGVRHLVGKRLLIVTIQYRLGSLGFLSTGTKDLPGNAALWDMVLATQWVRNYIGFFGGNPHRIVVMGHGSGASSSSLVALSKVAKGISGVISMSGSPLSPWTIDQTPRNTAMEVAQENGCPTNSVVTMIKCLQNNVKAESLIQGDSNVEFRRLEQRGFMSGLSGQLGAAPVNEGFHDRRSLPPLVEDDPINQLNDEKSPKIPLLTGVTRDETKNAVNTQYKEDILKTLNMIPNFLDTMFIQNLQKVLVKKDNGSNNQSIGGTGEGENSIFGILHKNIGNFKNYLQVRRNSVQEQLSKISEVANDALFNVPAFMTADLWSKKGVPTYMYSFEHFGKLKKGHNFLKGSHLVGNSSTDNSNDTIAHGDDLAYLFDANDLYGNPIESDNQISAEDDKVREIFTDLISNFARTGQVSVNKKSVPPFTTTNSNFVQIKANPTVGNNFKFCEMGLWLNLANRLQSQSCQFLNVLDSSLKNVQGQVFDTLGGSMGKLKNPVQISDVSQNLGGVLKNPTGNGGSKNGLLKNPLGSFIGK